MQGRENERRGESEKNEYAEKQKMKKEGGRERRLGADSESLSSSCATSYANRIAFKLIIRTVGVCLYRACVCATYRKGAGYSYRCP